jgi:hypothetical protein
MEIHPIGPRPYYGKMKPKLIQIDEVLIFLWLGTYLDTKQISSNIKYTLIVYDFQTL